MVIYFVKIQSGTFIERHKIHQTSIDMKKILLTAFLLFLGVQFAFAQSDSTLTTTENEGITILPEAGEWGLGISANPFLSYLGNFFNQAGNNGSPAFGYTQNPFNSLALFGKIMRDENTAFRARFQLNVGGNTEKSIVVLNQLTPDPLNVQFVTDTRNTSSTGILLGFGLEKRRGAGRLQGIYGAEAMLGYASQKDKYTYGNALSKDFPTPNRNNFGSNIAGTNFKTEEKFGNSFIFGVRGFIGVEYFFAPKMSIGGEFGYSFALRTAGKGSVTTESYDTVGNTVRTLKTDVYTNNFNTSTTGIGLDNLNGAINLLFYF